MEQAKVERDIPINFEASFAKFENETADIVTEQKSAEFLADSIKFACVWQRPEVNMHIINQIINQMNVFHDNEYGDCTPSNITALISASFPSTEIFNELSAAICDDEDGNNDKISDGKKHADISDITATFVASTPVSTIKTSRDIFALKDTNNDKQMLLLALKDTSPIFLSSRPKTLFSRRRLHLS
jgi:hypothetical protein